MVVGRTTHSGFISAVGYAGFTSVLAIALENTFRTGVMLTNWRAYHRRREPIRYWIGLSVMALVFIVFVAAGIAVLRREGLDGLIPHPGGLISTTPD
jgi:hypothetical protein